MLKMSSREEFTIYVFRPDQDSGVCGIVLPYLDFNRSNRVGYFHSFVGKTATINVVAEDEEITRERALEIAARYVTRQCHITRMEFPPTDTNLKRIIQRENERKNRRFAR